MRNRSLPLLSLLLLTAVPAFADDVYLVNGRKFEGVIAETAGSQVRIRMQGGTLSLPKDQVLRVEAGDSNLAEFLRRKEALKKSPTAGAADWVELARWARAKELDQATREAALAAATLDPRAAGLAPILRGYGYVLDPQLDRWVPYADSMRRRGFVLAGGQWLTHEELQSRQRAQEEASARYAAARQEAARAAREDRIAALAELSVARQLGQQEEPQGYPPFYGNPFYGSVIVGPGFFGGGGFPGPRPPHRRDSGSGFTHVPGSLIGGSLFPGSN
ncbi:MAG TPA: hypothetical protein VGG20_27190 [Thermoanaerobaculia bacterium]|jgi:hypothetical protein